MNEKRLQRITQVVSARLDGIILILEDIHDPHNAAAILRTADAMGIQNVWFIFENETPYNPKRVGKATSSSANKWLDFRIFKSSNECIAELKKQPYRIIVSALTDSSVSLETYKDTGSAVAIVVGNEHRGVSKMMLSAADTILKIPMAGFVQSLNVSVATAIILWEITRQRMHSGSSFALKTKDRQKLLEDFLERAKK